MAVHPGEWEVFLAHHPELTGQDFTRRDLLRALREDLKGRTWVVAFRPGKKNRREPLGATSSSSIASSLCPMPSKSLVRRVGRELGKMADEGLIIRLRPRDRGQCLMWTLPGHDLAPHIERWYPERLRG